MEYTITRTKTIDGFFNKIVVKNPSRKLADELRRIGVWPHPHSFGVLHLEGASERITNKVEKAITYCSR